MSETRPNEDLVRLQRRLRRGLLITALIACGIAAAGIGVRLHAQTQVRQWTESQAIPTVDVVSAQPGLSTRDLILPGTLSAYFDAPIYARVSGYLKRWYDDIGAPVRAGQTLADIETPELDQQIHQVEADLVTAKAQNQLAKITAERWHKMLASQSVSQQAADEKASNGYGSGKDLDRRRF